MPKDRRSRDQKRKAKLAKKNQKQRQFESLAYMGERYKTEKLVPIWYQTETAIYEAYVIIDRELLDGTVANALETLINKIRAGTLPPLANDGVIEYEVGNEEGLVIETIRRHWETHFETKSRPPKEQLIGVLRSILGSVENIRSPGPRSQTYLRRTAGFLTKKLGISVQQISADSEPLPEPEEDALVLLGRRWIADNNQEARAEFHELASDLMNNHQTARVIDACHQLVGEEPDPSLEAVAELMELSIQARQSNIAAMG